MDEIVDNPAETVRVAILGLGEAGTEFAADLLAAGAEVSGWDPAGAPPVAGLRFAADTTGAVAGAAVVLSLNSAADAPDAVAWSAPSLSPEVVFADLNTAPPALKRELAASVEATGARFADVALLGPVPGSGIATPALASGSGAEALVTALAPLGMRVEAFAGPPGAAAERKLLRSVFFKGCAAAAVEAVAAGRAAGCEEWLRQQLIRTLNGDGEMLLDRWLEGSRKHATRRAAEMEATAAMLDDLGTPPRVSAAARDWLTQQMEETDAAHVP